MTTLPESIGITEAEWQNVPDDLKTEIVRKYAKIKGVEQLNTFNQMMADANYLRERDRAVASDLLETDLDGKEDMITVVADNVTMGDNAVRSLGNQTPLPQPPPQPQQSMLPWVLLAAALAGAVPATAIATYMMTQGKNVEVEVPKDTDTSATIRFVDD